jgi:MFS family permease
MTGATSGDPSGYDDAGRPIRSLPVLELVRLSVYWLGLSAIFTGLTAILTGRLQFAGMVPKGTEGAAYFQMTVLGSIIAALVQPTIGSISDYTVTRWGRRKPYIFIGSILDVVFLFGIASSNTVLSIAAFFVLLQFSSNAAQGPFQGYVPDLVPAPQVGLASALVGLMQVLGNVAGFAIGAVAVATNEFFLGTMALGVVELVTMLSVVLRVREGRAPKDRAGRSWGAIAREAWGSDILAERSFLFLVGSRLFVLMGGGTLIALSTFYLAQTFGLDQESAGRTLLVVLGVGAAGNVVAVIPAGRISDRVGRKPVIWASCLIGGVGMAITAVAPSIAIAVVGVACIGISGGVFLAVDWALMTDIIPKASSGRYMGISNVATASSGILAVAIGGNLMDAANASLGYGAGPRAALTLAIAYFVVGAVLLVPVDARRREDAPAGSLVAEPVASAP